MFIILQNAVQRYAFYFVMLLSFNMLVKDLTYFIFTGALRLYFYRLVCVFC